MRKIALTKQQLAGSIDHTMLKIWATYSDIAKLCYEAIKYNFASVAVNPVHVSLAKDILKGTNVKVTVALGFYLGIYPPEIKEYEARDAVKNGADELDMLVNVAALKSGRLDIVEAECKGLVKAAEGRITKLILETGLLNDDEIKTGCKIAEKAGINFVKSSTGFKKPGATVEAVRIMRTTVGQKLGVKAAGGIKTTEEAINMIEAGADRLGVSAGIEIIERF
jgi:deoxyribose-phosphate aldolase